MEDALCLNFCSKIVIIISNTPETSADMAIKFGVGNIEIILNNKRNIPSI